MEAATIIALASAALMAFNKSMEYLEAKKQNAEMTPEDEAAYDKLVEERMKLPHWQKSKP